MAFQSPRNSLRPHRLWHWDSLPALTCCSEPQVRSRSGSLSQWTVKQAQTRRSPGSSLQTRPHWLCEWHPIFPMSHRAQAGDYSKMQCKISPFVYVDWKIITMYWSLIRKINPKWQMRHKYILQLKSLGYVRCFGKTSPMLTKAKFIWVKIQ